jgi:hypothetical protein
MGPLLKKKGQAAVRLKECRTLTRALVGFSDASLIGSRIRATAHLMSLST